MENSKVSIHNMDLYYGDFHALKNLNREIPANQVTAFIGPSGCGKSTCIKSLNRMNDLIDGCKITGTIKIDGADIYAPRTDVTLLRKRAGMVCLLYTSPYIAGFCLFQQDCPQFLTFRRGEVLL